MRGAVGADGMGDRRLSADWVNPSKSDSGLEEKRSGPGGAAAAAEADSKAGAHAAPPLTSTETCLVPHTSQLAHQLLRCLCMLARYCYLGLLTSRYAASELPKWWFHIR